MTPKTGFRHWCIHRGNAGNRAQFHTSGSGKPRARACRYCRGAFVVQEGWWGCFVWSGGTGRYAQADAVKLFASEKTAQRFADTSSQEGLVVRWVDAPS